jgi:hypothetical protein
MRDAHLPAIYQWTVLRILKHTDIVTSEKCLAAYVERSTSRPDFKRAFDAQIGEKGRIARDWATEAKGHAMAKNTICLWYDKDAEAAARFYAETSDRRHPVVSLEAGRRDAARANQGVLALTHVRNRPDSGLKIGGRCYRRFVPEADHNLGTARFGPRALGPSPLDTRQS